MTPGILLNLEGFKPFTCHFVHQIVFVSCLLELVVQKWLSSITTDVETLREKIETRNEGEGGGAFRNDAERGISTSGFRGSGRPLSDSIPPPPPPPPAVIRPPARAQRVPLCTILRYLFLVRYPNIFLKAPLARQ